MKKKIIILSVLIIAFSSFKLADSIILKIGMNEQWVQREIKNFFLDNDELNVTSEIENVQYPHYVNAYFKYGHKEAPNSLYGTGSVPYWISQVKKYIVDNSKTETAKELCTYLKNYVESDLFINEYQKIKAENKPTSESASSKADIDNFKTYNDADLKAYEDIVNSLKKKGKNEMIKPMCLLHN
jgi:hypothetical protein